MPDSVKNELQIKVMEETRASVIPAIRDLKKNYTAILDMRQLSIECLMKDPGMMVDIFQTVSASEIVLFQHVAAVMGLALRLAQLA